MADLDFSALESLTELGKGKKGKGDKQSASNEDGPFRLLDWDKIEEDPNQPRTHMDEDGLKELADSIKQPGKDGKPRGILQPISVRENPDKQGHYLINYGHRRHRAQGIAGLKTQPVPAIIDNDSTRTDQLLENIQREDLDAFDIAKSIEDLVSDGMKVAEIAKKLGKKPAHLSLFRTFFKASSDIQKLYSEGLCRDMVALADLSRVQDKFPSEVEGFVLDALEEKTALSRAKINAFVKGLKKPTTEGGEAPPSPPPTAPGTTSSEEGEPGGNGERGNESLEDPEGEENPPPSPPKDPKPPVNVDTDKISRPVMWVSWKIEGEDFKGRVLLNRRPSKSGMIWVEEKDSGRPFEVVATGVILEELTESK